MPSPIEYPPELLSLICSYVYASAIPSPISSLDPLYIPEAGVPTDLPSSYPPPNWSEPVARRTLTTLTLVNRAWSEAARPWLWRKIEVRLPRSWLAFIEEISGGEDGEAAEDDTARAVEESITEAAHAALAAKTGPCVALDVEAEKKLKESIIQELGGPDSSIPPELLSPPASRDPSPRRLRQKSKSPARWKLMRSISDAVQDLMGRDENGMHVPAVHDRRPGRFVHHLDFNHFRTIGMRRLVGESLSYRFVTGERLEAVLKETPNLTAFGATEYMDGALTLPVLKELLLRGAPSRGRGQPVRGRGFVMDDPNDWEAEDIARRHECKELEAIDFTGCVSVVFVNALTEFVNAHVLPPVSELDPNEDEDDRSHRRSRSARLRFTEEPMAFPGLQRLSLRGAKSVPPQILNSFVTAFPSLTHLDLSSTRASPDILDGLAASPSLRLQTLSLARCVRLTGSSIRKFLVSAPAARYITELNLYGDNTFPNPMSVEEFHDVFTMAPCFTSGGLVYLDISSAPLDQGLLDAMPVQTNLRSLGLSFIPGLPLKVVSEFIRNKAGQVEVLTLVGTSPELVRVQPRQASVALYAQIIRPLCTLPFKSRLTSDVAVAKTPTRLRVIELATPLLSALGASAGQWRIVRSKGGRGWWVDTASGWMAGPGGASLQRDLDKDHPWRQALEMLADANGNVSSGVGWHARKMEVLHGHGLLGREDGLYGAVSFAYQG
ncbi:hypothetical protein B0F90DRAFT_1935023 [Multifurca ochricompacta]|uniref:F-box domain-containing protein n=1 Tax=Multifurca ochricompacta TaxID=376703 RepID=A0AAD4M6U4_9AGAM|nr:hypothetical protein B0F90DRAFT_1935023 [Multifurca ochricompacta]